jgi:hypothetical protein
MDIFAEFATDPVAEETGRWIQLGDAEVLVARAGNTAFNNMIQLERKKHQHTLDLGEAKDASEDSKKAAKDLSFKIVGRVMAQTLLLNWRGNLKYKGEPIAYSRQNAEMLLQHNDFREKIAGMANDIANFRVEQIKADAKNFEPVSAGNSSGDPVSNSSNGEQEKLE